MSDDEQPTVVDPGITMELKPWNGRAAEPKSKRACAACTSSFKEGADLVCRFNPPTASLHAVPEMVPGPGGRPQQVMALKPFSGFPIVRPDFWCAKFEQK